MLVLRGLGYCDGHAQRTWLPNAGAVGPVHIRSSCLSSPTVSDRYSAGAYTPSLGQSARYRPPDTLQSTVATLGCFVRIARPRVRPLPPPGPNKPLPPYVQSRRG